MHNFLLHLKKTVHSAHQFTKEQKAELVKFFAEKVIEVMGLPVEAIVVLIREMEPENVGVGNILL
jgi:4-oxalocrotonate tautomerase